MESYTAPMQPKPPKLLDQVAHTIRLRHMSYRTEQTYLHWIRRYIIFHNKTHPKFLGAEHLTAFLTHLAVEGNVSASTQNQALAAILFLYRHVLEINLPWLNNIVRAKRPKRLPVVLTQTEIINLFQNLEKNTMYLMIKLIYGAGLRLTECLKVI